MGLAMSKRNLEKDNVESQAKALVHSALGTSRPDLYGLCAWQLGNEGPLPVPQRVSSGAWNRFGGKQVI